MSPAPLARRSNNGPGQQETFGRPLRAPVINVTAQIMGYGIGQNGAASAAERLLTLTRQAGTPQVLLAPEGLGAECTHRPRGAPALKSVCPDATALAV
jgi:hypothetical protein